MSRLLPSTGAVTGIFEAIGFFRDPDFATKRFVEYGDIFETTLIGQRLVFIRGDAVSYTHLTLPTIYSV